MKLLNGFVLLITAVYSLHYYADTGEEKCFTEDLPVGIHIVGSYKAQVYDSRISDYADEPSSSLSIKVWTTNPSSSLVDQKGQNQGKFRFTSSEIGEHHMCFKVENTGWFNSRAKVLLDIQFGEDAKSDNGEAELSIYSSLTSRMKDLNERLRNLRLELQGQRVCATNQQREAEYRSLSEVVNTDTWRWSLVQMILFAFVCAWQVRHMKKFFQTKKLV